MRDQRWVAEHRGGPLKKEQHRQLILWACECAEHVLPLLGGEIDVRLKNALLVAKAWAQGKATTGEAMKAAVEAHAAARASADPVAKAVARCIGHAVATAHMADHSLGVIYALKAVEIAGKPVNEEKKWQNEHLPPGIRELILSTRGAKEKAFQLK